MAKIDIPHLVIKRKPSGRVYCYWQPSATLRKAGWTALALGADLRAARAAAEAQNDKVEAWRSGGARPRQVRKFVARGTVAQLIERYEQDRLPKLSANTQKEYRSKLRIIQRWAGNELVDHITRDRVRTLKRALLKPDAAGHVSENRAAGTMRVARSLWQWAIDEAEPRILPDCAINPFADQNMPTPAPRDQFWSPAAIDLFTTAAIKAGQPSLALAIHLGREVGQREDDYLKLTIGKWIEIPRYKLNPEDWERMAEPGEDGMRSVMGIRIRQGKTNRWVEIPIVGVTRRLMDEAVAEAKAANSTLVLLERQPVKIDTPSKLPSDGQGATILTRWTETRFQRAIASLRVTAAEIAAGQGDDDLAQEIQGLQYRDLRRTAVVWLGELGIEDHLIAAITGHKLDQTRKILETYLPRTTKMAGRAIALRIERAAPTVGDDREKKA